MAVDAMIEQPAISVVIPTHRRAGLLAAALDSIARQTLAPAEILVIDDVGDDETVALLAVRAADFHGRLRYVRNAEQPGACGSRNRGAHEASSDLLAFLDDDDEWQPEFLALAADRLRDPLVDFALVGIERTFPDGSVKQLTTPPGLTRADVLHHRVYMTGSSFVIRRAAFDSVGGFDRTIPVFNDWDLFIRLVTAGRRYAVVDRPLIRWNEHDGDRITTASLRRAEGIEHFLRVHGKGMSYTVRAYYLRIAFGIRKARENTMSGRLGQTLRMFGNAGLAGTAYIAGRAVRDRLT